MPRKHGYAGKKPSLAVIYDDVKNVVEFLQNYADRYGFPQPAAPRGSDNTPPIYLDSGKTKLTIHKGYIESCREDLYSELLSVKFGKAVCVTLD